MLQRDLVALIDDIDKDKVCVFNWYAKKSRNILYAFATSGPKCSRPSMHRLIMGFPSGMEIDHINGNGLDNRRDNLRIVTRKQNCWNRGKHIITNGIEYRGVRRRGDKYIAMIGVLGIQEYLGIYKTKEEAASAYNKAAIIKYGEYARLNIISATKDVKLPIGKSCTTEQSPHP